MEKMTTAFDVLIPDENYISSDLLDDMIKICYATYIDHMRFLFDLPEIYNSNDPDREEDRANMESLLKQKKNTEIMCLRIMKTIDFLHSLK